MKIALHAVHHPMLPAVLPPSGSWPAWDIVQHRPQARPTTVDTPWRARSPTAVSPEWTPAQPSVFLNILVLSLVSVRVWSRLALAAARSPLRWHGLRRVRPGRHVLPRFHCCGVQRV